MHVKDMSNKELEDEVRSHFQDKDFMPVRVQQLSFIEGCIAELEERGYLVDFNEEGLILIGDEDFEDEE